jgi:hypothetical protein
VERRAGQPAGGARHSEAPEDPPIDTTLQQPQAQRGADDVRDGHGGDRQPRIDLQREDRRQETADAEPGDGRDRAGDDGDDESEEVGPHGCPAPARRSADVGSRAAAAVVYSPIVYAL